MGCSIYILLHLNPGIRGGGKQCLYGFLFFQDAYASGISFLLLPNAASLPKEHLLTYVFSFYAHFMSTPYSPFNREA